MKMNFKKMTLTALIGYAAIIGLYNSYELVTIIETEKDIRRATYQNVIAIYKDNGMPSYATEIQYLKGIKW